ncbi:acyltransferase domain-containing protein [Amycolatopsis alba]|uniref:acyltransferase domain-containing protein n=1 Tax=Amycolatopsis alba TaxID=76020 RepID=UPI0003A1A2E2|nr:acyltransferase domain-containing protein [Amycolatopsis alba]
MPLDVETSVGLFPGQGGYRQGFLAAEYRRGDEPVRETFDIVDEAAQDLLRTSVIDQVFRPDPPDPAELFRADAAILQLAVFASSVSVHRMLRARGATPDVLVGHSLGEIAALTCGGALELTDAARIVCHRVIAVAQDDEGGVAGGMTSLSCTVDTAAAIVRLAGDDRVAVAVDNGPHQCVVSGPTATLGTIEAVASALGISAARLYAPVAFHSPAVSAASSALVAAILDYPRAPFISPVYSPILGRYYRDGDDLPRLLGLHLLAPVPFGPAVGLLRRAGAGVFVEVGAGGTLTGAVRAAFPEVTTFAFGGDAVERQLAEAVAFLAARPDTAEHTTSGPTSSPEHDAEPALPPDALPAPSGQEADGVTHEAVLAEVRAIYADAMEYPEEVLTPDAHLEADLGVDSMKRTELLVRVLARYGLEDLPDDLQPARHETLGAVSDAIYGILSARADASRGDAR